MLEADEAYSRLAAVYDVLNNPVTSLGVAQIQRIGPVFAGRDVLDLGCGTGAPARQAEEFGPKSWIGVDRVAEMLSYFDGTAVRADFRSLPFEDSSFDVVLFWISLGYVDAPATAFVESTRVLRPRGRMFILDLHPIGASLGWTRSMGGLTIRSVIHSSEAWSRCFEVTGLQVVHEEAIVIDESVRSYIDAAGKNFSEFDGQELLIYYELQRKCASAP